MYISLIKKTDFLVSIKKCNTTLLYTHQSNAQAIDLSILSITGCPLEEIILLLAEPKVTSTAFKISMNGGCRQIQCTQVYMLCFIHYDQKVGDTYITVGHAFKIKHIIKIMYFYGFSIFLRKVLCF